MFSGSNTAGEHRHVSGGESSSRPRGAGAERAGEILERVLAGLGLSRELEKRRILGFWAEAVGPEAAAHSEATGLRGDRLLVEVDHPAWMQELKFLEPEILARLHKTSSQGFIRGIRFTLPRRRAGE